MKSMNLPNAFYDLDQVQRDFHQILPSPDDPVFVDNFQAMTRVMAEHLLSQRSSLEEPVFYDDLYQGMALSNLLNLVGSNLTSPEICSAIQSYVECISRCSWKEIQKKGTPSVAWMNHNFCYVFFLDLVRD